MKSKVDIASLVFFRISFGAIMVWEVFRYFFYGRIFHYYIEPDFYFPYYGFEWVKPWPALGMYLHFTLLGILALCILLGFFYRLSSILFFLSFTYIFLLDQTQYLNHFYLICLISFLMMFLSPHHRFSLDSLRNPEIRSDYVPAWMIWILRFQIGIPYFFGGIAKLNPDWLHGEPMRMWLHARSEQPLLGTLYSQEWFVYLLSYGGLVFDLLIVPFLLIRQTRLFAFGIAVVFHLMNAWIFQIGIFPWFMICGTTLFFEPNWPRKIFQIFPKYNKPIKKVSKLTSCAICIFVFLQLVIPLRHFLYPGKVHWTEEGHQFSWHMKLRDKEGIGRFILYWPDRDKYTSVNPIHFLSPRQARKMITRPEMILSFAHYLSNRVEDSSVEIYADILVSLNGHPFFPLIDPSVNLVKVKKSLLPSPWIFRDNNY